MVSLRLSSLLTLLACVVVNASPHVERQSATLKAAAGARYFGAALGVGHLQNASDPNFASLAATQFSGSTPENEMKWDATEPEQGVFTFAQGDVIQQFAAAHGHKLRGHTLVWHNQLPAWVTQLSGAQAVGSAMVNHIQQVMGHFKGKIFAWYVVNEAFNDDGTFGSSPFLTALGSGYIFTAFQTARAADPNAKLFINDFGTESINVKSDALLSVVQNLTKSGLIDGVGFQSHFILGEVPTDLQANLQRFANLGVQVAITELDVRIPDPVTQADLEQQATDFATVVNACQAVTNCVGITTWGIGDIYSWVNFPAPGTFPGNDKPLLFDDNYVAKPAFSSVINAFET
ncbi:hypothetical protein PUNSTDRAFT_119286 [Punctularia strigosozonata HHB-11173 SS5]|uniref:uncharacterized protein n=1 Tax=Punctularia strigosozonata (strain HHB-11173) TaxID=741275 RepID=UPI0004416380|nr:uncharacterized protein PUNSTDRAFT_119286 [Punctularia strigosozonata HHB-11173 SS5]EIN11129.1 hypothetical protein PUNSTDRAFT_119286 [Punctularia strigosozonata HHB-11173 SS5]